MNTQQKEWLKELETLNNHFKESYKKDMMSLMHRFITDSLVLEDFIELCEYRGIDSVLEDYYSCVMILDDEEDL